MNKRCAIPVVVNRLKPLMPIQGEVGLKKIAHDTRMREEEKPLQAITTLFVYIAARECGFLDRMK